MPTETVSLDDAILGAFDENGVDGDQAEQGDEITAEVTTPDVESDDEENEEESPFSAFDDFDEEDTDADAEEARLAGLRQADYTRKTQELAIQRQALEAQQQELQHAKAIWDALQEDPRTVIEALVDKYQAELESEGPSPEARRIRELEEKIQQTDQKLQEQDDQAYYAQLVSECQTISAEFNDPFEPDRLLQFALENEIPNLRAAYLLRRDQVAKARAAADEKRRAAKQAAPPVAGGSSRAAGTTTAPPEDINSFEDAFNAALAEL